VHEQLIPSGVACDGPNEDAKNWLGISRAALAKGTPLCAPHVPAAMNSQKSSSTGLGWEQVQRLFRQDPHHDHVTGLIKAVSRTLWKTLQSYGRLGVITDSFEDPCPLQASYKCI
jgi:hypothetical protein